MWWRRASDPAVEAALARVRIFASLPRRDLRQLAVMCLLKHYDAGDVILEEGSTGLGLFLITSGRVEVFKTKGGRRIRLAVLSEGDVLGEMALLDDQPRSASAVAVDAAECLLLSRGRFRTLLERRPRIAWPIVPALADRIRDLQGRLLDARERASVTPVGAAAAPDESPAVADAGDTARPAKAPHAEERNGAEPDLLRTPYALVMSGATGLGEAVRLFEVFFRTLDEESGLSRGRPMGEVVRGLPASLLAAGGSSWESAREMPSKVLDTFRDHLETDRRAED